MFYSTCMKTIIYIDGQNFLYKAAEVLVAAGKVSEKQDLHTISLRKLLEDLLHESGAEIRYYGTKLKKHKHTPQIEAKSKTMIDSQRRLRNNLASQNIAFVESGKLKVRDGDKCRQCNTQDYHFQEKGVDVRLAVDMVLDSHDEDVVKMVVVSSDTDLLPAIEAALAKTKHVIYVGFSNKLTNAILSIAPETQIIRDTEIVAAYDDSNPQQPLTTSTP
jgi:uncharacterized LabA/DUF88 family protein